MEKRTKEQETGYHELTGYDLAEEVKYWEQEKTKAKKELEELQDNLGKTKEKIEKEEARKEDIIRDIEKFLKREEEFQEKAARAETLFKEAEKKLGEEREKVRIAAEKKEVLDKECCAVSRHIQELSAKQESLTADIREKDEELRNKTGELQKKKDELQKIKTELDLLGQDIESRRQDVPQEEREKAKPLKEIQNPKNQKQGMGNTLDGLNEHKDKPKRRGRKLLAFVLGLSLVFAGILVYVEKVDLEQRLEEKAAQAEKQVSEAESAKKEVEEQLANAISEKEKTERQLLEAVSAKEEAEEQLTNAISEKEKAEKQLSDERTIRSNAEKRFSDAKVCAGDLLIKVNSTYNAKEDQSKLSDKRIAEDMRYLQFDYDVLFLKDDMKPVTIYLDIYNPDGTLFRDSVNSPAGHTCSKTVSSSGQYKTGWGNSEKSSYEAGTYRVDFIYMNRIVCSKKFDISR